MAERVTIVEVGPRDGLQNEPYTIPTKIKIGLIERLADTGLGVIEATSFVAAPAIPQLADAEEVMAGVERRVGVRYPVLVPNMKGYERARSAGANEIAVITGASGDFSHRNITCSIAESLERLAPVIEPARTGGVRVRGYVSTVLGCPFPGKVPLDDVVRVAEALLEAGCAEISLGDTIGVGTPGKAHAMLAAVAQSVPLSRLAVHFHDTYCQALANIFSCQDVRVSLFDYSMADMIG